MKKLLIALVLLAALLLAAVACTAPIENDSETTPRTETADGTATTADSSASTAPASGTETTDSTTTQAPSGDNTDETGLANGGADTDSSWGELHPIN